MNPPAPRLDAAWPDGLERPDTLPADLLGLIRLHRRVAAELDGQFDLTQDQLERVVEAALYQISALIRSGVNLTLPNLGTFQRVPGLVGRPAIRFTPNPLLLEDSL